jgi:hypothetical protein
MNSIWDISANDSQLTFIDIIKGIVPLILSQKINGYTKNKEMTQLIISIFMDYIYSEICKRIWFPRCSQQMLDEKNAGIDKKEKKKTNRTNIRSSTRHRQTNVDNSIVSGQKGVLNSILQGGSWQDFTIVSNFLLR